ncbi:MAG TPA: M20/M25/M40 family metallo-hydrolase [Steroidobacteraceae bacterium]|jgi:acetylornithine deacetylase/succinyl-diaminopimelate desuccinylase-like protein|nr:M20/M25/M40 family metallo-hydrolase [Steroidobacteraceae bacterium]
MRCLLNAALGVLCISTTAQAFTADLRSQVEHYRIAHEVQIVAQLDTLTWIRSVAADPAGIAAAANQLQQLLQERGFQVLQLSAGPATPPLVFGELRRAGVRHTVVFYAHYDGQPVTPSQWRSDPFVPVMRSGPLNAGGIDIDWRNAKLPYDPQWRFFGRAASDDKASIVAFLAAFDALKASGRRPSVNLKVVWDGEEEAGSPHIGEILRRHQVLFASDLWLIGDAPVHQSRRQMLYFGARGSLSLEATVYGPARALHDGHYGNWAPNPAAMAARLIAQLRDDEGRILIPQFADDIRPLTAAEQAAIRQLPPVEAALKQEFAIGRSEGREGLSASLMRPALNIRGIRSGQVGAAAANAIPIDAVVSFDFRLVPDQTPQGVRSKFERFLKSNGWTVVADEPGQAMRLAHPRIVRLQWGSGYPAFRTDMSGTVAKAVIATAGKAAQRPVAILPMMGASVPIYLFADIFKVPVIGLPIVNHDNNQHAANENLRLQNLRDGIHTYAAMMAELTW